MAFVLQVGECLVVVHALVLECFLGRGRVAKREMREWRDLIGPKAGAHSKQVPHLQLIGDIVVGVVGVTVGVGLTQVPLSPPLHEPPATNCSPGIAVQVA